VHEKHPCGEEVAWERAVKMCLAAEATDRLKKRARKRESLTLIMRGDAAPAGRTARLLHVQNSRIFAPEERLDHLTILLNPTPPAIDWSEAEHQE